MLTLERLARESVACWERGDLASAVRALDQRLQEIADDRVKHQDLIERAIGIHADDDIDIDADDTFISTSDEGAFVMGWLWMPSVVVSRPMRPMSASRKMPRNLDDALRRNHF